MMQESFRKSCFAKRSFSVPMVLVRQYSNCSSREYSFLLRVGGISQPLTAGRVCWGSDFQAAGLRG